MFSGTISPQDAQNARAELYRRSLKDFIHAAWPHVVPDQALSWNWHHDVICERLEAVSRGEVKRLLINVPPGTGKSILVSVLWPAWEWASNPSLRYMVCTYEQSLSVRDNLKTRALVQSEWYQGLFDVQLSKDQTAKTRFDTTAKGTRIGTTVGGMGTGEHPDRIIIDDPMKAQGATSRAELDTVTDWFGRTVSTRVQRDPAMVCIMQRLHEDDLAGHLRTKGGWTEVVLPMEYDPERPDERDKRLHAGDLLWPDAWPREKVEALKIDLGAFGVAGQLQQNPVPEGGGLFKRDWFIPAPLPPLHTVKTRVRGWDTASTKDGGDWTVGVLLWETHEGLVYVVDVIRIQEEPGDVHAMIVATAAQDGRQTAIMEEREGGSSGKSVGSFRARALSGYTYESVPVQKGKADRADAFRAQAQAGNVRVLQGAEWLGPYLNVMCSFPVGKHDDDVDATSVAFNYLSRDKYGHIKSVVW